MGKACAFSGHRPEKLPWGTDETDLRCKALKLQMEQRLRALCEDGVDHFICGMARGTDQYFIEVLVRLQEEYPLTIEAALPCPGQQRRWPPQERRSYLAALGKCDRVTVVEPQYSQGCMLRRNRYMVDHAEILMTVFDGSPGGTAATVRYAQAKGRKIMPLWR
jgi:uncharacterized phage-like protein YoqJ